MNVQPLGQPRELFKGQVYKIIEQKVKLPDGTIKKYEFVQKPSGVIVIARDEQDLIVLVREKRLPQKNHDNIWALPGGLVKNKETPEKAALRELNEETGLTGQIEFFARRPQAPRTIWDLRVFVATNLKEVKGVKPELEIKKVPLMQAVNMALEDEIENDYAALSLVEYALRDNRIEILEKEIDPRIKALM